MYSGYQQYSPADMAGYPQHQQTGFGQPVQQPYGYNPAPAPQQYMQPGQGYAAAPVAGHAPLAAGMPSGHQNTLHTGTPRFGVLMCY